MSLTAQTKAGVPSVCRARAGLSAKPATRTLSLVALAAALTLSALLLSSCQITPVVSASPIDDEAVVQPTPRPVASDRGLFQRLGKAPERVTGLGRLEPGEGVIDVGASPGDRVATLEVEENDEVVAGQVLARLESHAERLAERDHQAALKAESLVHLRKVSEAGPLAVKALEAEVRRLGKNLELARSDLERLEALIDSELVTERDYDHQRTVEAQARESLSHSQILLERERSMLDLTIASAEAELATADSRLQSAETALERTIIRAPVSGRILEIQARAGEPITGGALLMMGETSRMYAVAEIYETEVRFLKPDQRATISSPALDRNLEGTVERIGSMIYKNDVLGIDPSAGSDSRIVEVRIRLDENEPASRFVHLQVEVTIET